MKRIIILVFISLVLAACTLNESFNHTITSQQSSAVQTTASSLDSAASQAGQNDTIKSEQEPLRSDDVAIEPASLVEVSLESNGGVTLSIAANNQYFFQSGIKFIQDKLYFRIEDIANGTSQDVAYSFTSESILKTSHQKMFDIQYPNKSDYDISEEALQQFLGEIVLQNEQYVVTYDAEGGRLILYLSNGTLLAVTGNFGKDALFSDLGFLDDGAVLYSCVQNIRAPEATKWGSGLLSKNTTEMWFWKPTNPAVTTEILWLADRRALIYEGSDPQAPAWSHRAGITYTCSSQNHKLTKTSIPSSAWHAFSEDRSLYLVAVPEEYENDSESGTAFFIYDINFLEK